MNIYECKGSGGYIDWICAESIEQAFEVYKDHTGNDDIPVVKELSNNDLKHLYMLDFSETEPDELDLDDEDYDPDYDPDQWVAGGKIIETFEEYIKRQKKPHFLENYQNE